VPNGETGGHKPLHQLSPERVEYLSVLKFNPFRAFLSILLFPWVSPTVIEIAPFQGFYL
jgi:hypothetical protein